MILISYHKLTVHRGFPTSLGQRRAFVLHYNVLYHYLIMAQLDRQYNACYQQWGQCHFSNLYGSVRRYIWAPEYNGIKCACLICSYGKNDADCVPCR